MKHRNLILHKEMLTDWQIVVSKPRSEYQFCSKSENMKSVTVSLSCDVLVPECGVHSRNL